MTKLDQIARFWARGMTTSKIAACLRTPKNSICRMVFDARKKGDTRFPRRDFAFSQPRNTKHKRPTPQQALPLAVPVKAPRRIGELRLLDLRAFDCRFPVRSGVERGDHWFCGAPVKEGSSWCPAHYVRCVSVQQERRKH